MLFDFVTVVARLSIARKFNAVFVSLPLFPGFEYRIDLGCTYYAKFVDTRSSLERFIMGYC